MQSTMTLKMFLNMYRLPPALIRCALVLCTVAPIGCSRGPELQGDSASVEQLDQDPSGDAERLAADRQANEDEELRAAIEREKEKWIEREHGGRMWVYRDAIRMQKSLTPEIEKLKSQISQIDEKLNERIEAEGAADPRGYRLWMSRTGEHQRRARFLATEGDEVLLENEGKTEPTRVKIAMLSAADRRFIGDLPFLVEQFEESQRASETGTDWARSPGERDRLQREKVGLQAKLESLSGALPNLPDSGDPPRIEDVVQEMETIIEENPGYFVDLAIAAIKRAKDAEKREEAKIAGAQRQATRSQEETPTPIDLSPLDKLKETGLIDSYRTNGNELIVTVSFGWHPVHYQNRLQLAQAMWEMWAAQRVPSNPDAAFLKLVDLRGNKVGGSARLFGSNINVNR